MAKKAPHVIPMFAIGSKVSINGKDFEVIRYHQVRGKWEVMLRSVENSRHISVDVRQLENQV